jgi:coenzyme F420-reducing hydrogenase gamma subunit
MSNGSKPRFAVFKFASCDGCQLQLLNLEDELLAIVNRVDLVYFLEASSEVLDGPYDIAIVEGSITTAADAERVRDVRKASKFLVTVGACANAGGIQALRNSLNLDECIRTVYPNPAYIDALASSSPVAAHVPVDFAISGCPISKEQLLEVLTALLIGRVPQLPTYSVCVDCKRRGNVCVLVSRNLPCIGPITQAGCGAVCPAFYRGCFGCYGPMESANADSLCQSMYSRGISHADIMSLLNGFAGGAEQFHAAADRLEKVTV